ncbi:MAG TPA: GMC family oxidoreductase, partial [Polyangiaceae bacterium]|nr:GMC family oxidoreductase [Polyangiaceae bacterium]
EAGSGNAALGLTAKIRGLTVAKLKPRLTRRTDLKPIGDPAAELFEVLAPGGLSNHWACAVPRFSPDDFADAARGGELTTWPLGYADLEPFYERVEPLLRIAGSRRSVPALPAGTVSVERTLGEGWSGIVRAASELGRDVVAMPYAFGAETMLTRSATAFNAYTQLVKPIERSGALSVRYDTQALRLVWSPSARRVVAVVCRDATTGAEVEIPCRAVVLAAGAVNSAQILLESASADFPDGLGNGHGVLGRYLHDHPLAKLVVELGTPLELLPASYVTRPSLERTRPLYAAACMQWTSAREVGRALLSTHPGRTTELGFSIFGTMAPVADNFVALDGSAPASNRRASLRLALRHEPAALDALQSAKDDLVRALDRAGLAPRVLVFKIEPPGNSVHYGGTCRMHASAQYGVVDRDCRVFDVPNVAVADSAVFTTGPEKNPVLTAMTLAARASERLAEAMRSGDL